MPGHGSELTDPSPAEVRRWWRMPADERESALVYRELAARRDGDERDILLQLADAEERHAAYWAGLLGDRAGPPRRGNLRMRVLSSTTSAPHSRSCAS